MLGKRPDGLILIDGYITEHELRFLVLATTGKEGVEIGSWFGRSTVNIIQRCKSLICVDHFLGTPPLTEQINTLRSLGLTPKEVFEANIERYNVRGTPVSLMAMSSMEAVKKIPKEQLFDFVFIDGSHEYEDVKNDILLWGDHIRGGGIILGHDYKLGGGGARPGVDKAVDELFPDGVETCCSIWWKYV